MDTEIQIIYANLTKSCDIIVFGGWEGEWKIAKYSYSRIER